MSDDFIVKDSGGGDFKQIPPGTFIGRCYRIIDLGTQASSYNGQPKAVRKLMLGWEVFGSDDKDEPLQSEDGKPLTIAKRYTNSLSKKAILRGDLEGWRGRAFTKEELDGFNMKNILEQYCMLSLVEEAKDDKIYTNVNSISRVPKEMRANLPAAVHEAQIFHLGNPDWETYEKFHDRLKGIIAQSPEYQEKRKPPAKGGSGGPPKGHPASDLDDEDIPF